MLGNGKYTEVILRWEGMELIKSNLLWDRHVWKLT